MEELLTSAQKYAGTVKTFKGHADTVRSVAFSPDGRWALSGSADETLRLWELSKGRCVRTFKDHTDSINSVAFAPDSRWALSGSRDKTVRLWELSTGRCLRTFERHTDEVNSVTFSLDGRWALSGSKDKTLRLWELDWEYEFPGAADWDEGARPYLETFLTRRMPPVGQLPQDHQPTEEEIVSALSRRGQPEWSDTHFKWLINQLCRAGYGWLRPRGVRRKLEKMTAEWQGPPTLFENAARHIDQAGHEGVLEPSVVDEPVGHARSPSAVPGSQGSSGGSQRRSMPSQGDSLTAVICPGCSKEYQINRAHFDNQMLCQQCGTGIVLSGIENVLGSSMVDQRVADAPSPITSPRSQPSQVASQDQNPPNLSGSTAKVTCPTCAEVYQVDRTRFGERMQCRLCKTELNIAKLLQVSQPEKVLKPSQFSPPSFPRSDSASAAHQPVVERTETPDQAEFCAKFRQFSGGGNTEAIADLLLERFKCRSCGASVQPFQGVKTSEDRGLQVFCVQCGALWHQTVVGVSERSLRENVVQPQTRRGPGIRGFFKSLVGGALTSGRTTPGEVSPQGMGAMDQLQFTQKLQEALKTGSFEDRAKLVLQEVLCLTCGKSVVSGKGLKRTGATGQLTCSNCGAVWAELTFEDSPMVDGN